MYFYEQLRKGLLCKESTFILIISIGSYFFFGESQLFDSDNFLSDFTYVQGDNILVILFPILLCLPMAMKIVSEFESGYFGLIVMRTSIKKYTLTKLVCNGIVGGALMTLPALVYLIRLIALKGIETYPAIEAAAQINLFPRLFETHPVAYAIMVLVGLFLCGVVFATLSLGVAAITKKKYLTLVIPICYYIGSAIVFPSRIKCLDATTLYDLNGQNYPNLLISLLYAFAIFSVGSIMFIKGVGRNVE